MSVTDTLLTLSLSPALLILLVFAIALIESLALIGVLVPGVVLITATTSLAGHQTIDLPWLLGAAFFGAIIGDGISFQLGYHHREKVVSRWPLSIHPEWLARGARFFERYGIYSVFIGRFVGPVRPIIPLVAGMMRMPLRSFMWANVTSAVLWAPAYVLPGYLLGRTWQQQLNLPANVEMAVIIMAASIVVLAVMFSWGRAQVGRHGAAYRAIALLVRRLPIMRKPWLSMSQSDEVPLASMLLFLVALIGVSAWTLLVIQHAGPLPIDFQALRLFQWLSIPFVTEISVGLAKIGDSAGIAVLLTPWALWLLVQNRFDALSHWGIALGGTVLVNMVGKAVFERARPDSPDYLSGSFSYPSAHTSTIIVVLGLAAAFGAAEMPRQRRAWVYWLAMLLALPIALSPLILGVHWLSDVIGGALAGLLICALVRLNWQRCNRPPLAPCPWVRLAAASLVLLCLRIALFPPV